MAERRSPGPLIHSPQRIRQRSAETDWARLPEEEVWGRARPGQGPWGSLDGNTNWATVTFVGGFGLVLLGIFFAFPAMILAGVALLLGGAVAGVVQVVRRRGKRSPVLWAGMGTRRIRVDEPGRTGREGASPDDP